jgi:hypothetical protein
MYFLTQKINVSARDIGKTRTNSVKERLPLVVSLE